MHTSPTTIYSIRLSALLHQSIRATTAYLPAYYPDLSHDAADGLRCSCLLYDKNLT
jgi:hypothetical protein